MRWISVDLDSAPLDLSIGATIKVKGVLWRHVGMLRFVADAWK
jgi:hypothetical protein